MKPRNFALLMLVMALMAIPSLVLGDTYIQTAFHSDAMQMGQVSQPASDDTSTTWMGDNVAVTDNGSSSTLIDGESGMLYMIDHEKKSYIGMPLDALGDIEQMMAGSGVDPEEAAMMAKQMQAMMSAMKMEVTVTPTEETKEIKGWACKKYLVDTKMGMMGSVHSEVWATKDVQVDYSMFAKLMSGTMMQMAGAQDALKEMEKVDGFQVLMEGKMSGTGQEVGTKMEVLKVETKVAPEGTYDIPKDYKKEQFEFGAGMR